MKAQYRDNGSPGYGQLILTEALFPDSPWTMSLQRASDKKFLTGRTRNPWVGETVFLAVDGGAGPDGSLIINIGPVIVDQLDPQEQYAITIRGEGQEARGRLRVVSVTYSAAGSLGTPTAESQASRQPAPALPPETEPQPQAEPQSPSQPNPAETPPRTQEPLQMPPANVPAKSKTWRWAILALLVAGCIAWFVLDPRKDSDKPAPPATSKPEPEQIVTMPPKPAAEPGVEEQVRKFFASGNITPNAAAALAAKLQQKSPAEKDAVYRLLYFAAENGDTSVLPKYGESLDPSVPQFGTIKKDAVEAWAIYKRLKQTSPQAADAAMERLYSWLKKEAGLGNAQARDWLRQIDKNR